MQVKNQKTSYNNIDIIILSEKNDPKQVVFGL